LGPRYSVHPQTGHGAHPAFYAMGNGSLPGVKWPEGGVNHPLPSTAEVKEYSYIYTPSVPLMGSFRVNVLFYVLVRT